MAGSNTIFQSLRVVDELEEKYAQFPGLNLTFETREGILKHCSKRNARQLGELGERFLQRRQPGLEAQLANIADEIAYNNHDVDDGLRAGLLTAEELCAVDLFREKYEQVRDGNSNIGRRVLIHETVRAMIDEVVTDLVENTREALGKRQASGHRGGSFIAAGAGKLEQVSPRPPSSLERLPA